MEELKRHVSGQRILPEGETLPAELEEVFSDFAAAAKELFSRPNDQVSHLLSSPSRAHDEAMAHCLTFLLDQASNIDTKPKNGTWTR